MKILSNDFKKKILKKILNFLDLKWEDQIKNYNKNIRPVTTIICINKLENLNSKKYIEAEKFIKIIYICRKC